MCPKVHSAYLVYSRVQKTPNILFFLFKSFLFYLISIQFFITLKLKKKKKRYIRLKFQRKQKQKTKKQKKPEGEKSEK